MLVCPQKIENALMCVYLRCYFLCKQLCDLEDTYTYTLEKYLSCVAVLLYLCEEQRKQICRQLTTCQVLGHFSSLRLL